MRSAWVVLAGLIAAALLISGCSGPQTPAPVPSPATATLEQVKAKFAGLTADKLPPGYIKVSECVNVSEIPPPARPRFGIPATMPETAAMGFHYAKPDLFDDKIDPMNPEDLLLLDGDGDGKVEVVGVEYEADMNATSPKVFGQEMVLLPEGHPGMNFPHRVLHVWFVSNPAGTYSDWNPSLKCPA
ncbi:MAG: hypothetical protein QXO51_03000 [Halobacteria archaeon]